MLIRDPWLRALSVLGCAIVGFYLVGLLWQVMQEFADIILLFFMAWLVAFILEPVVGTLVEGRLPRLAAIALTYLTLLVLLSLGVILLVPALTLQIVEVVRSLPSYVEQVTLLLSVFQTTTNAWLTSHGSPILIDIKSALNPQELSRRVDALGPPILSNVVGFATGAATLLVELVIMLILSFYFMADGAQLADSLIGALPLAAQDYARFLVASIHRAFAGFLRGQMIQALVGGVGTGLIMSVLQVEFALLSSVVAAGNHLAVYAARGDDLLVSGSAGLAAGDLQRAGSAHSQSAGRITPIGGVFRGADWRASCGCMGGDLRCANRRRGHHDDFVLSRHSGGAGGASAGALARAGARVRGSAAAGAG
jgi:hypothetical protein